MSEHAEVEERPARMRLLESITFSWVHKILAIFVALYTTGVAVRHFGLAEYGIWLLISQLVFIVQLLDLGISSSISRVLPGHLARRTLSAASAFVSTSFWLLTSLGAVIVLLAVPAAHVFSAMFSLEPPQRETVNTLAIAALVITGLGMPARIGFGLLASLHRFDIYFAIETAFLLVRGAAVIVLFRYFEPTLWDFAAVMLLPQFLSNVIQTAWTLHATEHRQFRMRTFSPGALRTLLSLSAAALLTTAASALLYQASPVLIGLRTTLAQVAVFTLPLFIIVHAFSLIQVSAFMSPIASRLAASGDKARLRRTLENMGCYTLSVALLLAGLMLMGGKLGFTIWLGDSKVSAGDIAEMHTLLVVLAVGTALGVPGMISRGALVALGYHWHVAWADLIAAAVGVAAGSILMIVSEDPLLAMAAGISGGCALRGLLLSPKLTAAYLGVNLRTLLGRWFLRPLATAGTSLGLAAIVTFSLSETTRLAPLAGSLVYGCIWLFGTWTFVLAPEDRHRLQMKLPLHVS